MGHACPVCSAPQADGEHLANHLAFAALLHGDDHESWLDEHVPDWEERDPDSLAAEVVGLAEEVEHETVFDDTSDRDGSHDHVLPPRSVEPARLDPETRRIVEEAREMTRKRRGEDTEE